MTHDHKSISIANPLEKENEILAICYLNKDTDDKNQCILTPHELVIHRNSKEFHFVNTDIILLSIGRSKYLFYIIVGGIIAPLSLLGIYENILTTSFLLITFILALGLFYHGINGSDALLIKVKNNEEIIPLDKVNPSVTNFVKFVKAILPQLQKDPPIIHFFTIKTAPDQSEFRLFSPEEIKTKIQGDEDEILEVDLLKLSSKIFVKQVQQNHGLFVSSINKESIIGRK